MNFTRKHVASKNEISQIHLSGNQCNQSFSVMHSNRMYYGSTLSDLQDVYIARNGRSWKKKRKANRRGVRWGCGGGLWKALITDAAKYREIRGHQEGKSVKNATAWCWKVGCASAHTAKQETQSVWHDDEDQTNITNFVVFAIYGPFLWQQNRIILIYGFCYLQKFPPRLTVAKFITSLFTVISSGGGIDSNS